MILYTPSIGVLTLALYRDRYSADRLMVNGWSWVGFVVKLYDASVIMLFVDKSIALDNSPENLQARWTV